MRRVLVTVAVVLAALTASVGPASAAPPKPPASPAPARQAAVDRLCSSWEQVIPNVWAIVCLDRSGALFQPYGEMRNYSAVPVTMDQFIYLNSDLHMVCGTYPSRAVPGATVGCTNHTWKVAAAPRSASAVFWVDGVQKTLYSPSFP